MLAFGSPYLISSFPGSKSWIGEFSTNDVSQRAAVRALFGQTAIRGRIPVTVPDTVKRGDGMNPRRHSYDPAAAPPALTNRLVTAYTLLDRAVADGAFPGGVLAVGWNNKLAVHPFGKLSCDAKSAPVRADTIYDVASLTKLIVTATCRDDPRGTGRLEPDAPVTRLLPEWSDAANSDPDPAWRARVTPRMLLLHDSGLPAYRDLYKECQKIDGVLARVMAEPLVHEPGKQIEYSDLGFILLGEIIERLTGESLTEFARKENILATRNEKFSVYSSANASSTNSLQPRTTRAIANA